MDLLAGERGGGGGGEGGGEKGRGGGGRGGLTLEKALKSVSRRRGGMVQ